MRGFTVCRFGDFTGPGLFCLFPQRTSGRRSVDLVEHLRGRVFLEPITTADLQREVFVGHDL